jgi:hypothetical protein
MTIDNIRKIDSMTVTISLFVIATALTAFLQGGG